MMRTDGNFEATLNRKLRKYLTLLAEGEYPLDMVEEEFRQIILCAMRDHRDLYYIVGEGDAIIGDDGASLGE